MGYEGDRLQGVGLSGRETGGALGGRSLWGQPRPVRPGSALFLQDLLGLLLLFPLVAHVAEGAEVRELRPPGPAPGMYEARTRRMDWGGGESGNPLPASGLCRVAPQLGAPPGAEAGASARPDELFIKRPGPCSPAFRSQPPLPHTCRHYPASRCIKDLNPKPPCCPPDCRLCRHSSWEPLHAGCFLTDSYSAQIVCALTYQVPAIPKGSSSVSGLQLLSVTALPLL